MTGFIEVPVWGQEKAGDEFLVPLELEVEFEYDKEGSYKIVSYYLFDQKVSLEQFKEFNNLKNLERHIDHYVDKYVYNEKSEAKDG